MHSQPVTLSGSNGLGVYLIPNLINHFGHLRTVSLLVGNLKFYVVKFPYIKCAIKPKPPLDVA